MKSAQMFTAISSTIWLSSIFTCVEISPTNPYDKDYRGDYQFSITWDLIAGKENIYIFQTYPLRITDKGSDKFKSFRIVHPDREIMDYTIDNDISNIYFKKEYEGHIIAAGICPNELAVYDTSKTVKITHPFKIVGDTLLGIDDTIRIKIQCIDSNYSNSIQKTLKAIWKLNDNILETTDLNKNPSHRIDNTGNYILHGGILDNNNYIYWIDSITIHVPGYRPKIDTAYIDNYNPYLGDILQFIIKMNSDNLNNNTRIQIVIQKKDITIFPSRTLTMKDLNEPVNGQIMDTGIVDFNIKATFENGLSDSMSIKRRIEYAIPQPEFSFSVREVPTGDTVLFSAIDKNQKPDTKYIWTIKNEEHIDTIPSTKFKHYFEKETVDTIEIFGSLYGLSGKPDKMILKIKKMGYWLRTVSFPTEVEVVGDTVEWKVYAVDSTGGQIPENVEYVWIVSDSIRYLSDSNACKIFIDKNIDSFYVSVYAKINTTVKTHELIHKVYVKKFKPVLYFSQKKHSSLINNTVKCSVIVDDVHPGYIEQIYWKLDNTTFIDSTAGNKCVWSGKFQNAGTYLLYAWAKDNVGLISDTDNVTITVTSERPYIKNLTYNNRIFYKKPTTFYLETENSTDGGKVVKWFWDFDSDTTEWDTITDINQCKFTFSELSDIGQKTLRAKCLDESYIYSPLFKKDFTTDSGLPEISEISIDNSVIYIRDKNTYGVKNVLDINGTVDKLFFIVDNTYLDTIIKPLDTAVFHYTFHNIEDSGNHEVKIEAEDDDGFTSFVKESINVRPGKPLVSGISIKTEDSDIFLNDTVFIYISANDPNDTIKKVYISYHESDTPDDSLENKKPLSFDSSFKHIFNIKDTGSQTIKVWVKDNDDILSEIRDTTIRVKSGAPKLEGIATTDTIWVVDRNKIGIKASDSNGKIIKYWVDWDTDKIWDDSSTGTNTFDYSWDTDFGNKFALFKARVMDEDHLTTEKLCSLFVRLGRPVVGSGANYGNTKIHWVNGKGNDRDTLFYRWEPGQPSDVAIDTTDTNGHCTEYIWDWQNLDFTDDTVNSPIFSKAGLRSNEVNMVTVKAKDDDHIWSDKFTFYVFPDGPPDTPVTVAVPLDESGKDKDRVKILWSKKDLKDGDLTQYKILLKKNDIPKDTDVLIDFNNSYRTGDSGYDWQHIFRDGESGATYYYYVIARDERGSEVRSKDRNFVFP